MLPGHGKIIKHLNIVKALNAVPKFNTFLSKPEPKGADTVARAELTLTAFEAEHTCSTIYNSAFNSGGELRPLSDLIADWL